ncbi:aminoglycoside phosphotransferase family protein [Lentzea sp. NPDC042327]|uniref:phosphotransferase family protein n=1 Tax=Lentzea sp. NPDC042327 TaxID=3154801 RepID=UPI00340A7CF8
MVLVNTEVIEQITQATVHRVEALGGGTYNRVFLVTAAEGELVVKISPGEQPGLTYERDLVRTEALFCALGARVAPVPQVVRTDFSRSHVDGDVLVTTKLEGTPLFGRSGVDRDAVQEQLGAAARALHTVEGPGFGYPQLGLHETWSQAFTAMVEAVQADAERYGVALPRIPVDRRLFDEVRTPVLVHFDLWDGNVLVDRGLTGIVDGERAFWGDPVADLVSPALFGTVGESFLKGYGRALTDSEHVRLAAYRAYLYAIMLTERVPRGSTDDGFERVIAEALDAAVRELG